MWKHAFKTFSVQRIDGKWVAFVPSLLDDGAAFVGFTQEEALAGLQPIMNGIIDEYHKNKKRLPQMDALEKTLLANVEGYMAMNDVSMYEQYKEREARSKKGERLGTRTFIIMPNKQSL